MNMVLKVLPLTFGRNRVKVLPTQLIDSSQKYLIKHVICITNPQTKYKINTNLKQIIENTMKQNAQKKEKKEKKEKKRKLQDWITV